MGDMRSNNYFVVISLFFTIISYFAYLNTTLIYLCNKRLNHLIYKFHSTLYTCDYAIQISIIYFYLLVTLNLYLRCYISETNFQEIYMYRSN